MRDSGGSVLVRRRGNVDGRHQDGEQSGWQSGKHDVSSWRPRSPLYTYVDAAWIAIRTATSSDEPRRNERHRESPVGGATAEETRPQEKIRDDSHPRRVRTHTRFSISFSRFLKRFLAFFFHFLQLLLRDLQFHNYDRVQFFRDIFNIGTFLPIKNCRVQLLLYDFIILRPIRCRRCYD